MQSSSVFIVRGISERVNLFEAIMTDVVQRVSPTTAVAVSRFPNLSSPTTALEFVGTVVAERIGYIFHDVLVDDCTGRLWCRYVHRGCCRPLLGSYVRVSGRMEAVVAAYLFAWSMESVNADRRRY